MGVIAELLGYCVAETLLPRGLVAEVPNLSDGLAAGQLLQTGGHAGYSTKIRIVHGFER
jgi:hypothetical protein